LRSATRVGHRGDRDGPLALALRLLLDHAALNLATRDCALPIDVDHSTVEIHLGPLEPCQLSAPHTTHHSERPGRVEAVLRRPGKERGALLGGPDALATHLLAIHAPRLTDTVDRHTQVYMVQAKSRCGSTYLLCDAALLAAGTLLTSSEERGSTT
jgi:hypothetical protein